MRARKRIVATAVAGTGLALVGTVAYAGIPGANGTIDACYARSNGVLRVLDAEAGQTCGTKESPLVWSVQGPQGPVGPTGAEGEPGPPGPGLSDFTTVTAQTAMNSDAIKGLILDCPSPSTQIAVSGGGYVEPEGGFSTPHPVALDASVPRGVGDQGQPNGWVVTAHETSPYDGNWQLKLIVFCASL